MNDFEMYEKAFKYDMLVNYLFRKSNLSWTNETIGIDSYEFSNIMKILEPDRYDCKLENLKVREKEEKE